MSFEELRKDIQDAYESSPTIEEAERLAAKFLGAQMDVSTELRKADLDARMRKSGVKTIKATVYMENATKTEKKPSDTFLEAIINVDPDVNENQDALDKAEVYRDELYNYLTVFKEAHIYFRNLARGKFE